jgi:hypothetical protein
VSADEDQPEDYQVDTFFKSQYFTAAEVQSEGKMQRSKTQVGQRNRQPLAGFAVTVGNLRQARQVRQ